MVLKDLQVIVKKYTKVILLSRGKLIMKEAQVFKKKV